MHTYEFLFKNRQNEFFDASDEYYLSDIGKGFIAGQLEHIKELYFVHHSGLILTKDWCPDLRLLCI
jgi:glutamine synthetase